VSDHPLELQIMQALARNPRVHAEEIAVQALEGEVLLRGTVGGLAQRTESKIGYGCGRLASTSERTLRRQRRCSPL